MGSSSSVMQGGWAGFRKLMNALMCMSQAWLKSKGWVRKTRVIFCGDHWREDHIRKKNYYKNRQKFVWEMGRKNDLNLFLLLFLCLWNLSECGCIGNRLDLNIARLGARTSWRSRSGRRRSEGEEQRSSEARHAALAFPAQRPALLRFLRWF